MCRACELSQIMIGIQSDMNDNRKLLEIRLLEFDLVARQRTSLKELNVEVSELFRKDLDYRQRIGLRQAELISFIKSDMFKPHDGQIDPSTIH